MSNFQGAIVLQEVIGGFQKAAKSVCKGFQWLLMPKKASESLQYHKTARVSDSKGFRRK